MKTLADIKRIIKPGTKLGLVHHSGWNPGVREVAAVNSVGFSLKNGDGVSFCDWPKARDLVIISPKEFAIRRPWFNRETQKEETVNLLTYTIQ